jgi:hypothetical protein
VSWRSRPVTDSSARQSVFLLSVLRLPRHLCRGGHRGAAVPRVASREVRPFRSHETQRGASLRGGLSRSHTDRSTTRGVACSSERCGELAGPPRCGSGRAARCDSGLTIDGSRSETPSRRSDARSSRRSAEASRYGQAELALDVIGQARPVLSYTLCLALSPFVGFHLLQILVERRVHRVPLRCPLVPERNPQNRRLVV